MNERFFQRSRLLARMASILLLSNFALNIYSNLSRSMNALAYSAIDSTFECGEYRSIFSVTLYFRLFVRLKQCGYFGNDTRTNLSFDTISIYPEYFEKNLIAFIFIFSCVYVEAPVVLPTPFYLFNRLFKLSVFYKKLYSCKKIFPMSYSNPMN